MMRSRHLAPPPAHDEMTPGEAWTAVGVWYGTLFAAMLPGRVGRAAQIGVTVLVSRAAGSAHDRLARKVADLFSERTSVGASVAKLRHRVIEVEAARARLGGEVSEIAERVERLERIAQNTATWGEHPTSPAPRSLEDLDEVATRRLAEAAGAGGDYQIADEIPPC